MKHLLIVISLVVTLFGFSSKELDNLTKSEYKTFMYILTMVNENRHFYNELAAIKDIEYYVAAMAWKESMFGRNKHNDSDGTHGSYGVFQVQLSTAIWRLKQLGYKYDINNSYHRELILKSLLKDSNGLSLALIELDNWTRINNGDIKKGIASYNAGYKSTNSKAGKKYMQDVIKRATTIKEYIAKNNIKY